jgi:YbgC/YbaW family acyl-CoA thioester hydrolase
MPSDPSRFRVRSYELDGLGHLNHAVFLSYFEQARFDALEGAGVSPRMMREEGWGVMVVRVEVDFRRELRQGEWVRIRTGVESMRNSSMVLTQVMEKEATGETSAEARVVAVWVRLGGGPIRIPAPVREALRSLLGPPGPDARPA